MPTKILIAYAIFCTICFLYFIATAITIAWDIHRDNPDYKPKSNYIAAIASLFKMLIVSALPLVNIGILFVCLFHYEELKGRFTPTI